MERRQESPGRWEIVGKVRRGDPLPDERVPSPALASLFAGKGKPLAAVAIPALATLMADLFAGGSYSE